MKKQKKALLSEEFETVLLQTVAAIHPEALTAFRQALIEHDFAYLQNRKVNPREYSDPVVYHQNAMVASLLKKWAPSGHNEDERLAATFKKWKDAETRCRRTNQYLDPFITRQHDVLDDRVADFFDGLRKRVRRTLGRVPLEIAGSISAKSTFNVFGERNTQIDKLCIVPELTANAWIWLPVFAETQWARIHRDSRDEQWKPFTFEVVEGDRYAVASKNATVHRPIGIGPTLNVFYQLGVGKHIRKRLQRLGLLQVPVETDSHWPGLKHGKDSQQIHRALARKASTNGEICTIDVVSASDTVAYKLVQLCTQDEWFPVLSSLRAPKILIKEDFLGKGQKQFAGWHILDKFSAMGNGYTFELETVIFASIVQEVAQREGVKLVVGENFSVYGDDIICPNVLAAPVLAALNVCGFSPNLDKTFCEFDAPLNGEHRSYFRESCGGDYMDGVDVRPISFTKIPETGPEWITVHNQLWRWVERYPHLQDVCDRIRTTFVPLDLRVGVPQNMGDVGFHGVPPKYRWKGGCREIKIVVTDYRSLPLDRWDVKTAQAYSLYVGRVPESIPTKDILSHHTQWTAYP